jgi:hypothetical protein
MMELTCSGRYSTIFIAKNVAFHEHIHEKIRNATLSNHQDDINKYIITIKNSLKMITPLSGTTENETGLLIYILCQLKLCSVLLFRRRRDPSFETCIRMGYFSRSTAFSYGSIICSCPSHHLGGDSKDPDGTTQQISRESQQR